MRLRASKVEGEIDLPPSKSHTMRALLFALLANGKSIIENRLPSPDTDQMIRACQLLGAKVDLFPNHIEVIGDFKSADDVIQCGNSGQILRFIGAASGLLPSYTILTGDDSVRKLRLVQPLLDGLIQLGCFAISSNENGHPPIVIKGTMKGGTALIDGSDSQPVSGLLMASAFAPHKTELFVTDPGETPWVALTLSWLDRFKIPYTNDNFERYTVQGGAEIGGFHYTVPADWSSAAYPLVAAVITNSSLTLKGLDFNDAQGDKEIVTLLQQMGARLEIDGTTVKVLPGGELRGCQIDASRFIDALPLLAVLGCFAEGTTHIVNGEIARHKECDRISSIVRELQKMGARIVEHPDGCTVEQSPLRGAPLESYADHRMALSLAVAGLGASGETVILQPSVTHKSYPGFFQTLKKLGAWVE